MTDELSAERNARIRLQYMAGQAEQFARALEELRHGHQSWRGDHDSRVLGAALDQAAIAARDFMAIARQAVELLSIASEQGAE